MFRKFWNKVHMFQNMFMHKMQSKEFSYMNNLSTKKHSYDAIFNSGDNAFNSPTFQMIQIIYSIRSDFKLYFISMPFRT